MRLPVKIIRFLFNRETLWALVLVLRLACRFNRIRVEQLLPALRLRTARKGWKLEIPADWPRWRSIDWGFNNPFTCLWLAQDPDRRWYVYHEHYQARETLAYHAERIKQISGRERYRATWADHDAQDRYEFENLGIKTTPARKDVHLGIEAVQTVRVNLAAFRLAAPTSRLQRGVRMRL